MTAREMQTEFERLIQTIDPAFISSKKVDSDTIFYFLNAAQDRYIKQNYLSIFESKIDPYELKKRTDSFKSIIITEDLDDQNIILSYNNEPEKWPLPIDEGKEFFLYIRSASKVFGTYLNILEANASWVPNKFITQDEIDNVSTSHINKPILRHPCVSISSDAIGNSYLCMHKDPYTNIARVQCTYIRKPKKISISGLGQSCELAYNVHQEIVEMAVNMFISEGAYRLSSRSSNEKQ